LGSYRAYLFDVDGTLMYPGRAIEGTADVLLALKRAGRRILIVTNNSTVSRAVMAARLRGLGFPIEESDVGTAVVATAAFVAQERPGARVHVLGSQGLREELRRVGLQVVEDGAGAEYLVIGCDPEVTYDRLARALRVALAGARVVAVNLDPFIYDPDGNFPGCGMFVGAIAAATGREPDVVVGKPSTLLLEEVLTLLGLPASECLFVGDSLQTDVAGARAVGMPSLLVLTGVTDRDTLAASPLQPEYVLDSAAELVAHLDPAADGLQQRSAGGVRA
jgi:HAD superfamily hydrolase (TIGR01450 family)